MDLHLKHRLSALLQRIDYEKLSGHNHETARAIIIFVRQLSDARKLSLLSSNDKLTFQVYLTQWKDIQDVQRQYTESTLLLFDS